ncbi:hypothetical protein [Nonomuraea sp. C10]|uniref:hypothetical protein n=1 Tax=Nonomuraea sp. C10 TaxID=2600577 RepID=UPI0011CD95CF|nr:hypothetical protein [Nonomuraea sp. C10]TXK35124.1 hypothetical protein FR742_38340 [Nonomuraea sp. C10]
MAITDSLPMRYERMELADLLAMQVDGARRQPPLEAPLLNWFEGDAVVQLLQTLARLLADEPLGELSTELADKLKARLGQPPGHDPENIRKMVAAIAETYWNPSG